jgi:hypothetical protein
MQKFKNGDLVRVAKDLGPRMSHFTADCDAIVIGSYADQFGGGSDDDDEDSRAQHQYTLYLKDEGETSWYEEDQLTLIESGRRDKLKEWKAASKAEAKQKGDLDWIFANGPAVAEKPHGASIQALAECFGLTNLWGRNGEGITYYSNAMGTLELAAPYLKAGDKAGWLARCELLRANAEVSR